MSYHTGAHESPLDREISAYNAMKEELRDSSLGKWVVFYHCELKGTYEDFNSAAGFAIMHFGHGPYLIRQVGEEVEMLPVSVLYASSYDARCVWLS